MTSKEALEILFASYYYDGNYHQVIEAREKLQRYLERLEEINNVWHKNEPMESVDINGNHLQELYDFRNKLIDENDKFKKVIEILKGKGVQESFLKNTKNVHEYNKAIKHLNYFDELTQEEYDLLKEYL